MSVTIRRARNQRLRSKSQLAHNPSGHGKGKWHSHDSLWRYKMKSRRLRKISAASRQRNRMAGR